MKIKIGVIGIMMLGLTFAFFLPAQAETVKANYGVLKGGIYSPQNSNLDQFGSWEVKGVPKGDYTLVLVVDSAYSFLSFQYSQNGGAFVPVSNQGYTGSGPYEWTVTIDDVSVQYATSIDLVASNAG